jgi:hypothetical protein
VFFWLDFNCFFGGAENTGHPAKQYTELSLKNSILIKHFSCYWATAAPLATAKINNAKASVRQ